MDDQKLDDSTTKLEVPPVAEGANGPSENSSNVGDLEKPAEGPPQQVRNVHGFKVIRPLLAVVNN